MRSMLAEAGGATARQVLRLLLLAGMGFGCIACDSGADRAVVAEAPAAVAAYVGGEVCSDCHVEQADAWQGSQHALAMQAATEATVLGDFGDSEFRYGETVTRFFRRDGSFRVATAGADGELAEFEIGYTFGVAPLQQYLIDTGNGHVQALSIAWDTRPASAGGQRWFHLYPDEVIDHTDPLHWTGVYQRWNTMCADCHSTGLGKNYDVATDRFATDWASLQVDCEACHGPGSLHAGDPAIPPPALSVTARAWVFNPGEAIAHRVPAPLPAAEDTVDQAAVCARCHARRTQLTDEVTAGDPWLDGFRLELLEAGLYYPDGQIQDEVYVYGSFLQSAMARAGVECSDCHEPHGAGLKAEGNAICGQCHLASVFDQTEHHRHEAGTAAAECTSCHMREETYMVVDPRRDHSFRVPRPDLSVTLGSPNACNDCHAGQSAGWAAARIAEWYPEGRWNEPHFGQALAAGRNWAADGHDRLLALLTDREQPEIARATAMRLLGGRLAPADIDVLRTVLDSDGPLVQLAALEAADAVPAEFRIELVQRFLTDSRLALRTAAARTLLSVREQLSLRRQADLDAAIGEYLAVQEFNSDRPEGLLNAANVAIDQGRYADAESRYGLAIERFPDYAALYVNLADLYRLLGRADESEAILRAGLDAVPDAAEIELALGFALVRRGEPVLALEHFRRAAELATEVPDYGYFYAIAENDAGDPAIALAALRSNYARFPGHGDTLFALATVLRDAGSYEEAYRFAGELLAAVPGDAGAVSLLRELEQRL